MLAGVEGALRHAGFSFSLVNYSPFENIHQQIVDIAEAQYDGVIILATEMYESDFAVCIAGLPSAAAGLMHERWGRHSQDATTLPV